MHKLGNSIRVAEAVAKLAAQDVSLQYTVSFAVVLHSSAPYAPLYCSVIVAFHAGYVL
jgi:hypothetical protein